MIEVVRYRRQCQRQQRPVGQTVNFGGRPRQCRLGKQQAVNFKFLAQRGTNHSQNPGRMTYQAGEHSGRLETPPVGLRELVDQAAGLGMSVDAPSQLIAHLLHAFGSDIRII